LPAFGVGKFFRWRNSVSRTPRVLAAWRFRTKSTDINSLLKSVAAGVGNDPDTVPAVRSTNGGSWYAVPFCIVPERGQLSENNVQPSTKQACDVLHEHERRSYLANNSGILKP